MRSWSCIDYCLSQPQSSSKWCRQWRRLEPPGPTRDQGQCYHQPETPSEPEPVRQHSLCHVSSEHLMTDRNWYSEKSVICDTEDRTVVKMWAFVKSLSRLSIYAFWWEYLIKILSAINWITGICDWTGQDRHWHKKAPHTKKDHDIILEQSLFSANIAFIV